MSIGSKHRPALVSQAKNWSLDALLAGLEILSSTRARLRTSNHGRVLVEMAVVDCCLEELVSLTQLAQALARGGVRRKAPIKAGPWRLQKKT